MDIRHALARVLPILGWLPRYEPDWLRGDVIAGLTLWGILVPEAIAYAAMAGASLEAGLYTLLGSLVVYAILGTTRQAVSAPTSGSSIMIAAVLAPFLVTDPRELAELLVLLVLVVGVILLLCGLLRLGFVTAFISHSVMTGFIFGLAIHIAVNQAPKLFGFPRGHGETIYQLWDLIGQLGGTNWVTFIIGVFALALLYGLEARSPRAPGPLMIMVAGILVVSIFQLSDHYGVRIVGAMQTGLPALTLPKVNLDDVLDLLPGAFAIVLFVVSETLGVGHSLGRQYGYDIDPNQELGGLLSYGSEQSDEFQFAASYVDRILKGEKPADLPVQAPTEYKLVVNLKTAKILGLDVPPLLQQRANELIE
jgi:sulfate permease, SulP family